VTIETTLEGAVADTSSEDPVIKNTPAVPDDAAETEIKHPEGANDDDCVADVPEVTPTMTESDMTGDTTVTEVSSIAEWLLYLHHCSSIIHVF
jgi:hypothetical protein